MLNDGRWVTQPGRFELRKDGAFWATNSVVASIRSVRVWGRTYLVARSVGGTGTFYNNAAAGQRTRSGGSLLPAWQARVGQKWLLANEDPSSLWWTLRPAVEVSTIPGLSGYLLADGPLVQAVPFDPTTSETVGTMFLEVPLNAGRDLYDFDFSMQGGEEYVSFDSSVVRPAATVPSLASGSNAVTIGSRGLVEWYKVPAASAVTISGQSDWKLFDADLSMLDSGGAAAATMQTPAGAYLAVFGPAGSAVSVVVG